MVEGFLSRPQVLITLDVSDHGIKVYMSVKQHFFSGKGIKKCILLTIVTSKSVSFSDKLSVNFLNFDEVYDESNLSPYHRSAFPVQSHLLWVVIKILRKCLPNKSNYPAAILYLLSFKGR